MKTSASRHGGILMGLLLTAATLVCVAMIIGFSVARNVHVDTIRTGDGKDVSINTPAGNFSIRAHDHAGVSMAGITTYPGAHQVKSSGGAEFEWTSHDGSEQKNLTVAGAEMITGDSVDKVFDFYHDRLPSWIVSHDRDGKITLKEPKSDDDGGRFVVIHEKSDGTHIGVASIGTAAAN